MTTQLSTPFTDSLSLGNLDIVESVSKCLAPKLDGLRGKKIVFSCDDKKMVLLTAGD